MTKGFDFKSLDFKEQFSFRVSFARLVYGSGPYDATIRPKPNDERSPNEGWPQLRLELHSKDRKVARVLGKRPATALIRRHPTGEEQTRSGIIARGELVIGYIEEDEGRKQSYVEILGLLPPEVFDAVVTALIAGGRELLARCCLYVGLTEEREKVSLSKREEPLNAVTYLLSDLAITFDIGDQYDELSNEE
jgi:hypothetical protein